MNIKRAIKSINFRVLSNIYIIILTIFVIWMLFFDGNSYLYHRELNKEIEELEDWNDYHRKKIKEDKIMIKKLKNSEDLERYARERYLMRKDNEEIFIIEFDTIK